MIICITSAHHTKYLEFVIDYTTFYGIAEDSNFFDINNNPNEDKEYL